MVLVSAVESVAVYTVALSDVPWPGEWARNGRCRQAPAVIFFPGRGDDAKAAKDVCSRCPVLAECRAYVLANPGLLGVWGGLSGADRKELGRHLTVAPEPAPPPMRSAAGTRYRLLDELRGHPHCWARVARYATRHSAAATASQLRSGRIAVPPGRWRFEGRVNDIGGSDLYAYYEGANDG